ncbi:hypothetical protein K438DRAFT_1883397 [Mycena galopus ATCC 62051]|nr:hypothetical protein K438DRAFT_1883397 [Mycena galopus ATCC 62051]
MGFGWLLRFVPGTRACLYLLFSLPVFHLWCSSWGTQTLHGSPTWITATGFIGLHDDGGPTGCWTSLGIRPSTNTLGL